MNETLSIKENFQYNLAFALAKAKFLLPRK
jgi:hypothetical protein